MGLYSTVNTVLVGFFAFAALHYALQWWRSRREYVLLVFAFQCMLVGVLTAALVGIARATTTSDCQAALDLRTTVGLLAAMTTVWLVSQMTGLKPRWFTGPMMVFFVALALVNAFFFPLNGTVTALGQMVVWGEQIVVPLRSPPGWWVFPIHASLFAVVTFNVLAGMRLWKHDRAGGVWVTGAGILTLLVVIAVVGADARRWNILYVGPPWYLLWIFLIGQNVSREYARRGKTIQQRTLELESANKKLRDIKSRFEAVYNHHYQLAGLLDPEGRLLMANRTALELAGVRAEQVVGQRFVETPWWTHSQEAQRTLQAAIERASGGESVRFECTHVSAAGQEREIDFCISPVFDETGAVVYLVPEGHDITERKQAEEELRESEERYRSYFMHSYDAFMTLGPPDWKCISANPAMVRMFRGKNDADITDSSPWAHSPNRQPDEQRSQKKALEMIETAIEMGTHFFEWQCKRLDGEEFPASVLLSRFELRGKTMLQATIRDLTEQRRMEAQLRQTQKMEAIGTLAGGIAHDFNNILAAIIGYTDLALDDLRDGERETADYLNEALKAATRAKDLVAQILAFSRRSEQDSKPIHITPIIKEVIKLLRATTPSTIEMRSSVEVEHDVIVGDPTQIHQVLMNLGTNAVYAMGDSTGVLTLKLQELELTKQRVIGLTERIQPGRYLQIVVCDTGPGIDEANLRRIFDPFFTTKPKGEGTGMGLAVVHGIVGTHGGTIHASSTPGEGATFEVFLPLVERIDTEPNGGPQPALPQGRGERILLVDDEDSLVNLLATRLRRLGYQVEAKNDSLQALQCFREQPDSFDLALTDLTMPKMNGLDLAGELLALRPNLPVILCSGYSERITQAEVRERGIQDMLIKPFDTQQTADLVRRLLDEHDGTHAK